MKTNTGSVRRNGQAELRQNLSDAIEASGLSRAAISRESGVPYGRLSNVVAGLGWATREDMDKVCAVLEISVDEIKGDSLWKTDFDRYVEFDYYPWQQPTTVDDPDETLRERRKTRAICCDCGALRIAGAAWTNFTFDKPGEVRLTDMLSCRWCDRETRHALLNLDDNRNSDEEQNKAPTREQEAREELNDLVVWLRSFNVHVQSRDYEPAERNDGTVQIVSVRCRWDDVAHRWLVGVNSNLPARAQVACIKHLWEDRLAAFDLDHEQRYRWWVADGAWAHVMRDVDDDLARLLSVGRPTLALEAREAIASETSEVQR